MSAHYKLAISVWGLQLFLSCFSVVFATQASERESQKVEVTFYQLSKSEWSAVESAFKQLVATEAASYCTSNSACGLSAGFGFTTNEVGIYSGPTEDSKSLKISFYIDFPTVHIVSASSSTTYVVNSATTTTILANVRIAAESVVGRDITYIGDEFYSIDPDALLNKILIPVAFAVLLIITVLAVALHVWKNGKEKEGKQKAKVAERERRKKSGRVTPVHSLVREGKQYDVFWPRRKRKEMALKKEAKRAGSSGSQGKVATLSMKTSIMTCDSERALNMFPHSNQTTPTNNNSRVAMRHNTLPPLQMTPVKKHKTKKEKEEKKQNTKEKPPQENTIEPEGEKAEKEKSENEKPTSKEKQVIVVEEVPPTRSFL